MDDEIFNEILGVEIIYPKSYVDYNFSTIQRYPSGIASILKGHAMFGNEEVEFIVRGMTLLQVNTVEEAMRYFGVEMMHEHKVLPDGARETYFYADLHGLIKILSEDGD